MGRLQSSLRRVCNPCSHTESAPLQLYTHSVFSARVLMLSQIVCTDNCGTQDACTAGDGMRVLHSAAAEAAVGALSDAWTLMKQQKDEAGLSECFAWSCRLFVVPAVIGCLRSCMSTSVSHLPHTEEVPSSNSRSASDEMSGDRLAELRKQLSGVVVHEVEALHDGERDVLWALRAVVAR
jgi:hypothetical protein